MSNNTLPLKGLIFYESENASSPIKVNGIFGFVVQGRGSNANVMPPLVIGTTIKKRLAFLEY